MRLFSPISAGMVRDAADGRRVFQHGLWPARRRAIFVTAEEERRLRRAYERGVAITIAAIALSGPFLPFWLRAVVIVPAGTLVLETILRRMTARLPSAPAPESTTFSTVMLAAAPGETLLWAQLVFFAAFAALCGSTLVSYEDVGWRKYAGAAIGVAMTVQAGCQLLLLRRNSRQKTNGRQ